MPRINNNVLKDDSNLLFLFLIWRPITFLNLELFRTKESDKEYGDLYHVFGSKNRNPISLKIHLEGRLVIMELDTGPAVLVRSEGVYQKYFFMFP